MYKTRNTGTGNGMRRTRGMKGMLYSGKYHQKFRVISSKIPGNVLKHSREYCQTFRRMSSNIPGNIAKHSGECRQTSRGMWLDIPGKVAKRFFFLFIISSRYYKCYSHIAYLQYTNTNRLI